MSLYDRLLGLAAPKIPVHTFMAAIGELERGKWSAAEVASVLDLDAGEQAEVATLLAKIIPSYDSIALGALVTLTNVGTSYDGIAASKGLGFCNIQTAGITELVFAVRYNKVGTGTLSWQLWDQTNSAEIGVINDSAAAGDDKQGSTTITPSPSPMAAGFRVLRVRAKSTTGADDPVYYGAGIRIKRVERLTSMELHEILLLAEWKRGTGNPYLTTSAVKTRLGV